MNLHDPKLTAYALHELDEAERESIAHEVASTPEAQRESKRRKQWRDGCAPNLPRSWNIGKVPMPQGRRSQRT